MTESLKASFNQEDRELFPAGMHDACCVDVVDLGILEGFEGKATRKIYLSWEIALNNSDFDRPFTISKRYTLSLHEKSNLSKDLESWFSKEFTDEQRAEGFELMRLLGHAATIQVLHKKAENRRVYANVNNVLPKSETPYSGSGEYIRAIHREGYEPPQSATASPPVAVDMSRPEPEPEFTYDEPKEQGFVEEVPDDLPF